MEIQQPKRTNIQKETGVNTVTDAIKNQNGMGGNNVAATAAPSQQQGHPISTFEAFRQLMQRNPTGMEYPMNAYSDMDGGASNATAISPAPTANGGARAGSPVTQRAATVRVVAGAQEGGTPATPCQGVLFLDRARSCLRCSLRRILRS